LRRTADQVKYNFKRQSRSSSSHGWDEWRQKPGRSTTEFAIKGDLYSELIL
jgi:hypothetical protein